MTQQVQIRATTLAAATRRRTATRYAAEHDDAGDMLARAYRLRRKRAARHVSPMRTASLLR
jgi:hypothetical protein